MRTKIVYVLTSTPKDHYTEQLLLSLHSLRKFNPDAYVILLTEQVTASSLINDRSTVLEFVSECKIIDVPEKFDMLRKSRQLKTTMREHVQGDFLYIDCDTIITASLAEIDNVESVMAGVPDYHYDTIGDVYDPSGIMEPCSSFGLETNPSMTYINGGVLFVKDKEITHHLFSLWNKYWLNGLNKGVALDQPSLTKANYELDCPISILDGIWNCQMPGKFLPYLHNAKILHYFSIKGEQADNVFKICFEVESFWRDIKSNGLTKEQLDVLSENAKSMFSKNTLVYAGTNLEITNSKLFEFISKLYYNHHRWFLFVNKIASKIIYYRSKQYQLTLRMKNHNQDTHNSR